MFSGMWDMDAKNHDLRVFMVENHSILVILKYFIHDD